ncbi:DoxX family protein [Paenibacillus nasutitermitis]|uniref:DoxX family membrane protein n=1 Tax=Paenibacillus nasutitermitis TaxID=1652958 RepID=A0A916YR48_9BACL|nr:DoxX family protein [Paenibacillus nasutitermitis]GGD57355.1 hypothetical protein GCM10010911_13950 [Paenibacillus nasutitermitis]
MAPLMGLLISLMIFRTAGWLGWEYADQWVTSLRFAVAVMFLMTASAHWGKRREEMIAMIPPRLPNPALLVSLTGWLEIAGAAGIVIPATSAIASTGLALMLLAMFPANVYATNHKLTLGGKPVTPLGMRTILQIIFLAAVLLAGWLPIA